MAKKLFAVDGIARVFFGKDYISIGKIDDVEWGALKPLVFEKIENFYDSGEPIFSESPVPTDTAANENDSETVAFIKEILETRIRPTVQEDGGDIEFLGFDEDTGTVNIAMKGSCTNCPSSSKGYYDSRCDSEERNREDADLLRGRSEKCEVSRLCSGITDC